MTTIAGSTIDLAILDVQNNQSNQSRPHSRNNITSNTTNATNTVNTVNTNASATVSNQRIMLESKKSDKQNKQFFKCQRCKQRLKFEMIEGDDDFAVGEFIITRAKELDVVSSGQFLDFSSESWKRMDDDDDDFDDDNDRSVALLNNESFVYLPTSVQRTKTSAAYAVAGKPAATLSRIFDIASEKTKRDFPLCDACAKEVEAEMEKACEDLEDECKKYEKAIERVLKSQECDSDSTTKEDRLNELEKKIEEALDKEREADAEVEKLELELEKQKVRRRALGRNAQRVKKAEFEIWHEANQFEIDRTNLKEERDALEAKLEHASTQLDLLRRTNVYNDAFHIWHDGPFGTINGFRLGRTSTVPVEWDEINAAWGMATLLLQSLANAMKIEFRSHILRPMGSFPAVCEINPTTNTISQCYDLFGPVNIMTSHKYDRAICGFLACLDELGRCFAQRDFELGVEPVFRYPYSIEADKVDGKKVTFTFNRDEKWTASLKLVLTNLKMAVSYVNIRNG